MNFAYVTFFEAIAWIFTCGKNQMMPQLAHRIWYFVILPIKLFLKHKNKAEFKYLDEFEVLSSDFPALKTSAASMTTVASTASFYQKKLLILMVWSSLAPKRSIPVPFCRMDHQKSNFSLISDILSVGGCWGQPILLFWKLVDKNQMS